MPTERTLSEGLDIFNSVGDVPGVTFGAHVCKEKLPDSRRIRKVTRGLGCLSAPWGPRPNVPQV
jgi:hypothetical protein